MGKDAIIFVPDEPYAPVAIGLGIILILVLILPFKVRVVEENLEPFFFVMGLAAVGLNLYYGFIPGFEELRSLFVLAFKTPVAIASVAGIPIGIVQAVLLFGLIFYYYHAPIYRFLQRTVNRLGLPVFMFAFTFILGFLSSVISVIVSAVILAEIMAAFNIDRRDRVRATVYAAFALGIGAALTPIGEPLSTIAISKLNAPFDYLLRLLGAYVFVGVFLSALAAAYSLKGYMNRRIDLTPVYEETLRGVFERGFRVFLFVAALELLGLSFTPMVKWYFSQLPSWALYWINTVSAVLDNATLTAAEIGPFLTEEQIRSALMSLLISGGMLIPGNIPNIVAAGRLRITSREWAEAGIPFGIALLIVFFLVIEVLGIHVKLY